ncbi:MAG: hypothetical protein Fur0042_23510 [Cyanophyceae cyanobacterium]
MLPILTLRPPGTKGGLHGLTGDDYTPHLALPRCAALGRIAQLSQFPTNPKGKGFSPLPPVARGIGLGRPAVIPRQMGGGQLAAPAIAGYRSNRGDSFHNFVPSPLVEKHGRMQFAHLNDY